ncbi:hypothetical protein BU24DRAFT_422454 [Aaosphaeria arxii CBS 175.79]|uniref:Uncharacterized protein n=1 Tax=Aaosphaeria arxii CBS 175.79 TaxID=1450172 RepID=A0A6A5XTG7_9PLEO|nr:uncharacterized protein BU24DRAFT_422454 [Aaosphaeria arxii CBS 175.79]KAF2016117.1 hypothetical protein BU24DRAFT_422454 [Aaosphaeria arxii CBS 175.79]
MPATIASDRKKAGAVATRNSAKEIGGDSQVDENALVRLHVTPFTPALLKVYLAPSVLPLAQNISYHTVETFPDKGFGYVELPAMEAAKLKKKLNGSTLKGSKVKIEEAKPEKRKANDDAQDDEKAVKRAKKERKRKEQGVIEGAELPGDRKIKRGWTEPPAKNRKERKDKDKDKKDKKDQKSKQKESKYTKEPEMLFKTVLPPVIATEMASKDKSKSKKDKKSKKSKSQQETIVHEFTNNSKQPSFLKSTQVVTEAKPAVEYINGKGWVDEDGNVVEAETGKARFRRILELVDVEPMEKKDTADPGSEAKSSSKPRPAREKRVKRKATPSPSSSELEESSVVSSSSESEDSESEDEAEAVNEPAASSPPAAESTPEIAVTPSSPSGRKPEVHPLEALFKKPKPTSIELPNTPAKGLAPINTSFSFFGNDDSMEVDADASGNPPVTPFTERDLEWRGLRSAAPTPDTATVGRRFSFSWRKSSQEVDDEEDDDDIEAGKQLNSNTKANSSVAHLPGLAEEDEDEANELDVGGESGDESDNDRQATPTRSQKGKAGLNEEEDEEKEESEFAKWFWENRGENNRAWKKRRRETLKTKRLRENKKLRRAA